MIKFRNLAIGLALALGAISLSPITPAQSFGVKQPLGEIESSMESNLTWNLQNALLVYYPETKFVVNAKVKLKKSQPEQRLPKLPDALLSKDLTNLPGLPYLPEDLVKPKEQPATPARPLDGELRDYEIERLWVNVLVDRSLQQSDWSFIRRFVSLTANLEPERGDQVRIEALNFPEKTDFLPEDKEQSATPPAFLPKPQPEASKSGLPEWFPYAFIAGLTILSLIILLLGLRSIVRNWRMPARTAAASQAHLPAPAAQDETNGALPAPADKTEQDEQARKQEELQNLRTVAIDAIVGAPATCAAVFSRWVDEQGESGYYHTAIVLCSTSTSLLDLLEPHFGQEISQEINKRIATIEPDAVQQNGVRLLRHFDDETRKQLMVKKYDASGDALSFLHQMTDDQLQHLLKPLKNGVIAIVLAQLRTNRAARLLDKMEPEQRKSVLAAMGNIDRIPADVYQHIAQQLAQRAHDLKWMRYVRANGVDVLVKVLDYLDEESQNEALDYLQTQDVKLARKLNKHFMTFNQFIHMSGERLREAALDVDRETLAKSLVSLDDQVVEKIIQSLPEKLGEMVRASLETNLAISEDEITAARRALMRSVRSKSVPKVVNS